MSEYSATERLMDSQEKLFGLPRQPQGKTTAPPPTDEELVMLRSHYNRLGRPVPWVEKWCAWEDGFCADVDCMRDGCFMGG